MDKSYLISKGTFLNAVKIDLKYIQEILVVPKRTSKAEDASLQNTESQAAKVSVNAWEGELSLSVWLARECVH